MLSIASCLKPDSERSLENGVQTQLYFSQDTVGVRICQRSDRRSTRLKVFIGKFCEKTYFVVLEHFFLAEVEVDQHLVPKQIEYVGKAVRRCSRFAH